jgi:hypothetical protein
MHSDHDDGGEGNSQGTLPSQLVYIERKIMSVVFIAIKGKNSSKYYLYNWLSTASKGVSVRTPCYSGKKNPRNGVN